MILLDTSFGYNLLYSFCVYGILFPNQPDIREEHHEGPATIMYSVSYNPTILEKQCFHLPTLPNLIANYTSQCIKLRYLKTL